jgi:phosphatidylserine/phosphatidylglycerophosphate/cardiolipin synthase-like enzyme
MHPPRMITDAEHFDHLVKHGIAEAKVSVDIITANFKSMLVPNGRRRAPSIVEVMAERAKRGVELRVLHAGVPSGPALRELKQHYGPGLTLRRCPRVHAKVIVIDSRLAYVGSANLTGAGLGAKGERRRNFEVGMTSADPALIDELAGYFNALWEGEHCPTCDRRDVCPVPLEEPNL